MAATALLLWKKDAVRSWGRSTFLRAEMLVLQKTPERGKQLASAHFSGGTTVKLKQGRLFWTHMQLWQVQPVQCMEFCVPLEPSLEMRVSISFVGLLAGSCGDGFVEFGCDLGITPEIPFSIACLLLRTFWSGLPPSEKFAVLCFEIRSVNKANYVNNQIFSFVDFAIFPAITDVLHSLLALFVGGNSFINFQWSVRLWTLFLIQRWWLQYSKMYSWQRLCHPHCTSSVCISYCSLQSNVCSVVFVLLIKAEIEQRCLLSSSREAGVSSRSAWPKPCAARLFAFVFCLAFVPAALPALALPSSPTWLSLSEIPGFLLEKRNVMLLKPPLPTLSSPSRSLIRHSSALNVGELFQGAGIVLWVKDWTECCYKYTIQNHGSWSIFHRSHFPGRLSGSKCNFPFLFAEEADTGAWGSWALSSWMRVTLSCTMQLWAAGCNAGSHCQCRHFSCVSRQSWAEECPCAASWHPEHAHVGLERRRKCRVLWSVALMTSCHD